MKVILFDVDGTLILSGGAGKAAMESALAKTFGLPTVRDGVPYSGRTDRDIGGELLALHELEPSAANHDRLLEGYLTELPHALKRHAGRVLPGIVELLRGLQERPDVALGLLTGNILRGAHCKLSHFGLWDYFHFGGYGDLHLDRDDVAREALAACESHLRRPVRLDDVWVIGDTPLDVRCARAIGARAVAVATGWHSLDELSACRPDHLFTDLSDPAPLFAAWE